MAGKRYLNFIAGEWRESETGRWFEDANPANTRDIIGKFPSSSAHDVQAAIAAAKKAFEAWRKVPAPRRGEIVLHIKWLMEREKENAAAIMTREMGKILKETRGDFQEGIDTALYAASEGRRLFGDTVPCELPSKLGFSLRQPIGVCGIITPWNFPVAIPSWKILPAILCGNTVVFKPASLTPASADAFVRILAEAGLPTGVVNLVHGSGREVGGAILASPDVRVISFTGSSETGKTIAQTCGAQLKRVSLELGGKNAQIVMDDADLDLAVDGALWGAFGTTGQRCTATSRLILHKKIKSQFLDKFVKRVNALKVGDGADETTEMGPLVSEDQRATVAKYVQIGLAEGAELITGGKPLTGTKYQHGHFFMPTVFDNVLPKHRLFKEEIFGPVVSVVTANSFEHAIELLNDSVYGLSSSIYTRDVNRAMSAIENIEAGICYINGPTIGAEIGLPFGGWKETGNGHRESGHQVYEFYTEWKSVYVDYSGKLQRAQIDTESTTSKQQKKK